MFLDSPSSPIAKNVWVANRPWISLGKIDMYPVNTCVQLFLSCRFFC